MTLGDWVRSRSDEQLADFFADMGKLLFATFTPEDAKRPDFYGMLYMANLKTLQQECKFDTDCEK